jgi:hypothetical protein
MRHVVKSGRPTSFARLHVDSTFGGFLWLKLIHARILQE